MSELRKYNTATTIVLPLITRNANDLKTSPTLAAGDARIIKDEGASAATTNTLADEGDGIVSLALTATEMSASRIVIIVKDQTSPKEWEDTVIIIETYGHASAQHPFDLGTASTPQTGDNYARLGAPAGASVSADVAAVKTQTAAIETDTDDIQSRLPAALTTDGNMKADALKIEGADPSDTINAACDTALADYDGPTRAEATADKDEVLAAVADVDADVAAMQGDVTAIGGIVTTIEGQTDDIGVAGAGLTAIIDAIPTAAENADAVWDEALAGHLNADSTGEALSDAGAAGTPPTADEIAEAVLTKPIADVEGGVHPFRSLYGMIAKLVNKTSTSTSTLTVTETDDTTVLATQTLTRDASAEPVTAVDTD